MGRKVSAAKVTKNAAKAKPAKIAKPKKAAPAKKVPIKKVAVKKAASKPKVAVKKVATRPKKAAPKKPSGPKGYTAAEYETFKDFKAKFAEWSNQKLKDMLRSNLQSMSGNKDDLIYKCADGATLGQIPRCPKCFGGRPKWDYMKGTYHCSGYRDDEDFHNCHSNFDKSELTRNTWQHSS